MKEIIFPAGFQLEFIRKVHPRKHFHSGEGPVDLWLQTKALQQALKQLSSTKLLIDSNQGKIAGFYTLASSEIDFTHLPVALTQHLPQRRLPVAVLACAGVDQQYQSQGLGTRLLASALADCYYASNTFPFVAVILDSLTEEAKRFYERWRFEPLPDYPLRLFLSYSRLQTMMLESA